MCTVRVHPKRGDLDPRRWSWTPPWVPPHEGVVQIHTPLGVHKEKDAPSAYAPTDARVGIVLFLVLQEVQIHPNRVKMT